MIISRDTKYSQLISDTMTSLGHATNAQLLSELQKVFPTLSATTVHRTTSRLVSRGFLAEAPPDLRGAMRFDSNLTSHDHFLCQSCGGIRDLDVASKITPLISGALGGCKITGRLVIHGSCETCIIKQKEKV